MGKEEAYLIEQCRRGDIQGYERLYNRYSRAMYHTCLRVTGFAEDAEDVLQDAFMEAFANLSKLKDPEAFGGWLKRIVLNKSIDLVKRKRKSWVEIDDTDLANRPEEPVADLAFGDQLPRVLEALNALPDKYRVVMNLHIFEELGFEEMAVMMEVPAGTLRVRYLRGKQKIMDKLTPK